MIYCTSYSGSWHRLLWGRKCGRAKLSGGLVQEVRLIGRDREGGGSVCVSVLLPSLCFTLCEDQCRGRTIVMRQINPIKAKRVSFYSLRGMRQAELTSCTICSLFNQFPQLRRSVWWAVAYKACPCIHADFTSSHIWHCLVQCTSSTFKGATFPFWTLGKQTGQRRHINDSVVKLRVSHGLIHSNIFSSSKSIWCSGQS